MNSIGELFVELGAIGNSKEVKAFAQAVKKAGKAIDDFEKKQKKNNDGSAKANINLGKVVKTLTGFVGVVASAYWALDRLTEGLAKQNQQWLLLANQSDLAMSTLQKWETVGKIVGIDNVGAQIQSLEQRIFALKLTGEGAKGFQMGGIMPTNADDVMEQLRRRVKGMKNSSASYLLQQMGLDPQLLTLLRMGRKEWEEYVRIQRQFTLTEKQRKDLEKLNRELQVAKIKLQYIKDRIILALMPVFTKLTKLLADSAEGWARLINLLNKVPTVIKAITAAVIALKVALWALSAHPIIATITLALGLIIAIGKAIQLIFDDVMHYNNGGGSVLGVIIKGLQDLDIKGAFDFPVPKWLEYLIRVIDYFSKHRGEFIGGVATLPLRATNPLANLLLPNLSGGFIKAGMDTFKDKIKSLQGIMSPSSKTQINNANSSNSISFSNTFYTNQPAEDIYGQLVYVVPMAIG